MSLTDTIASFATVLGRSSIGIIRVSGTLTIHVAQELLGKLPKSRQSEYLSFRDSDGTILDKGIVLFFPNPHSFTGEDVLELQGHGGPVILDLLLKRIISFSGVRIARPGEFSERAFLNGKIDLTQAEGIADLIDASSAQAARSAINSLQGVFSSRIYALVERLTNLRLCLEAVIDFPDDQVDYLTDHKIEDSLNAIILELQQVLSNASQGRLLREGIKVVIAGKPNAGKSSLLNALVGHGSAIVSNIEGTTRDVLREHIHLDGMPLHIIDTAGLRDTFDEIERISIERAWHEIKQADHILLILDSSATHLSDPKIFWPEFIARLPKNIPLTVVRNKSDLTGESVRATEEDGYTLITLSAKLGIGIDLLQIHLKKKIHFTNNREGIFLARRRHLDALEKAHLHLMKGKKMLTHNYSYFDELLAEELKLAQQALSEITGVLSTDDLLQKIFSSFCIGK
ncbi:tRNA uridine-5-carboxymethylaminomethyl(34) synthesis GTPase MnmE [Candidatus Curculioniphilus buchneri]|uniref:tRNA uridine-5-carboxymethylaminomethyl(34) synthesis GTPase MnmE n=1 Tax=Candidatus Curculioniphilus buchneri TaxID=690594 RepID=UPI00376EFC71